MADQSERVRLEQTRTALDAVRQTLDTAIDQLKVWQERPPV